MFNNTYNSPGLNEEPNMVFFNPNNVENDSPFDNPNLFYGEGHPIDLNLRREVPSFLQNYQNDNQNLATTRPSGQSQSSNNQVTENNIRPRGRKSKNDNREAKHTKSRNDNQMVKIKTYAMNFIYELLNESLSNRNAKFLKINKKINQNINKDYNIELMQKTIKELYENSSINGRYNKYNRDRKYNQRLIEEIYAKNEEKETIKILDSKYIDLIELLRTEYLDKFYSDIYNKTIKEGESEEFAKKYVDELEDLLLNYEEWFKQKVGRKRKKN